jgi:hypothetical protein
MTKQETPSDQGKLPGKDLYDQSGLREPSNTDNKIDQSSQNIELLAYFDALSNTQCSEILCNLCADKEEGKFMYNAIKTEHIEATQDEITKAELYNNIMKERRKQNLWPVLTTMQMNVRPMHWLQSQISHGMNG